MLLASLAAMGVIKVAVGLYRDRPVGFLIAAVMATFFFAGLFLKSTWRSRAGDAVLDALRRKHAALKVAAYGPDHKMPPGAVVLATALFGTAVLTGGPLGDLRAALLAPRSQGGGGGASGCGSGCGGGGGCGGGCGGCS